MATRVDASKAHRNLLDVILSLVEKTQCIMHADHKTENITVTENTIQQGE